MKEEAGPMSREEPPQKREEQKQETRGQSVHRSLPLLQENLTFDFLNFLALFPWRPDESRMLAVLLGNGADGRNDCCLVNCGWAGRMTDAWEEATPWDFCDFADTYDWAGTSLDARKGYLLSYNRLSVPLEHKAFKTG